MVSHFPVKSVQKPNSSDVNTEHLRPIFPISLSSTFAAHGDSYCDAHAQVEEQILMLPKPVVLEHVNALPTL